MTYMDCIAKGIELAEGWTEGWFMQVSAATTPVIAKDALAAQLVRQVDATDRYEVIVNQDECEIYDKELQKTAYAITEGDRTERTIRSIVESGIDWVALWR